RAGACMTDETGYDQPDHCTVGVVGEVGSRLFLFYCRQGLAETTVKVEKQQVAVLARYLGRIVKELGRPGHLPPVRAPARPGRPRLPAHERAPAAGQLAAVSDATVERVLTEGAMEVHG